MAPGLRQMQGAELALRVPRRRNRCTADAAQPALLAAQLILPLARDRARRKLILDQLGHLYSARSSNASPAFKCARPGLPMALIERDAPPVSSK